jgi:hypothetical protein
MIDETDSVKVYLAKGTILPVDFISFTPKEQSLMIQIGYDTFIKTKSEVYENFTDKKKKIIKEELDVIYKNEIEQLKNEIKSQQESMNTLKNTYEKFIQMKNDSHKKELEVSERNFSVKMDQLDRIYSAKVPSQTEVTFQEIASKAFRDFDEFEMQELNDQYILKFKGFSVLVHCYTIEKEGSREKLKEELIARSCVFGWFISMDLPVESFDKTPFMFEWLTAQNCVCYVNSLLKTESPIEIIRNIYFTCQTIFKIMNTEHIYELNNLKQNEIFIKKTLLKMMKNVSERDHILLQFRDNFNQQDSYIRDILNKETNETLIEKPKVSSLPFIDRVSEWWNFHIVEEKGSVLRSAIIWTMFKRDNPDLIGNINAIEFKEIIYSFIPEEQIVKPRNKAGALEIQNIRWKIDRTINVSK